MCVHLLIADLLDALRDNHAAGDAHARSVIAFMTETYTETYTSRGRNLQSRPNQVYQACDYD